MTEFLEHPGRQAPSPAPAATQDVNAESPSGGTVDRSGRAARSVRREHGFSAAEAILHRSEWLSPADRQLLSSIFGDGHSVARLAPMLHTGKRSLRRRVKRLLDRLNSRRFAFVAVRHNHWTPTRRRVAAAVVLQGLSMREAAESLRLSLHNVRRHYDAINALFDASERANDTAGERARA